MKKLLTLALSALLVVSAHQAMAQTPEQKPAPQAPTPDPVTTVVGAVRKPGNYALAPGESLSSLLNRAGGAIPSASLSRAFVLRNGTAIPLDLRVTEFTLRAGVLELTQFKFRAGDVLVVPERRGRVFVVGAVAKSGAYELPLQNTSVGDVLALAGGLSVDQDKSEVEVVILRQGKVLDKYVLPQDAKTLETRSPLQDDDVVCVVQRSAAGLQFLERADSPK